MRHYLQIRHRIEDYARWKSVYDQFGYFRGRAGCTGEQVFEVGEDPHELVVLLSCEDLVQARRVIGSPELRQAMHHAGVVGEPEIRFLEARAGDYSGLARVYYDCFNRRNFDWGEELVSAGVEFHDMGTGAAYRGRDGYLQQVQDRLKAFPDAQLEITRMAASGDDVMVQLIGRGTHLGPFESSAGTIPATGRKVEFAFCDALRFHEGSLVEVRTYGYPTSLLAQLTAEVESGAA